MSTCKPWRHFPTDSGRCSSCGLRTHEGCAGAFASCQCLVCGHERHGQEVPVPGCECENPATTCSECGWRLPCEDEECMEGDYFCEDCQSEQVDW